MPAQSFINEVWTQQSPEDAFDALVLRAARIAKDGGFMGRSGTIAEKEDFRMVEVPPEFSADPIKFVELILNEDRGVDEETLDWLCDHQGVFAGCVELPKPKLKVKQGYLFFGWAKGISEQDIIEMEGSRLILMPQTITYGRWKDREKVEPIYPLLQQQKQRTG